MSSPNRFCRRLTAVVGLAFLFVSSAAIGQDEAAPRRLLLASERLERDGDLVGSEASYQLVINRFPGSRQAELAMLALARSAWKKDDVEAAHEHLTTLISTFPESPRAATASVLQARYGLAEAEGTQDLGDARRLFDRVPLLFGPEAYPTLGARVEAAVASGDVNLLLGSPRRAAREFLRAIEDEAPSEWLPAARLGLAESLLMEGSWMPASEILQRVADTRDAERPASEARRRLTFIHRHWLRPSLGQSPWSSSRPITGAPWDKPTRVAAGAAGRILVINGGSRQVLSMEVLGGATSSLAGRDFRNVWWGSAGESYLAEAPAVRGLETSVRQGFASSEDKQQIAKNITAGQRGLFGHWLLVDREKKSLMIFDSEGGFVRKISGQEIVDVARGPRGQTLLLDRRARRVIRLGLDFEDLGFSTGNWRRPEAITSDAAGNVYVLDTAERTITMLDRAGESRWTIGPQMPGGPELRGPEDLSIDDEGRLYVVDTKLSQIIVLE
jgi:hypothetical protein